MSKRNQILSAVAEAATLVESYPQEMRTSFDLLSVLDDKDIPVIFRPLDSLLGAAITIEGQSGILVNSGRNRQIQRFTLAHELGHILLDHDTQIDEEHDIFPRATNGNTRPPEEIAAEKFASNLLAPDDLVFENVQRQGWNRDELSKPGILYQLSLRLGLSFQATCWALNDTKILDQKTASELAGQNGIVKAAKNALAPESIERDSWADVWRLSQRDAGTEIEASSMDVFVILIEDNVSSGYIWDIRDSDGGLEVVHEESDIGEKYGSATTREVTIKFNSTARHNILFEHKRPWNNDVIEQFEIIIDNRGHGDGGMPQRFREKSLSQA